MDRVTLTAAEQRIATWVGEQRYASAMRDDRDPGNGPSSRDPTPANHIRGAKCEYAASIMLNLYWRPSIGKIHELDVGGLVEVRTGTAHHHRLCMKPNVKDSSRFCLIVMIGEDFFFKGWTVASDGKRKFPAVTLPGCDPLHYVEQSALRPMMELIDITKGLR